ncbi:MAG: histidine kinase [Acidobacteriota bacterium]|nr:histidine kinase [Acidobacteriota bacterium]
MQLGLHLGLQQNAYCQLSTVYPSFLAVYSLSTANRNLREPGISRLATEAELRTLRAQINPYFLFNALTTISYLIQTAPERALETIQRGSFGSILTPTSPSGRTVWEQKLQLNIAIPPAMPASMILISFFLIGGYQFTAHNRHWN